LKHRFGIIAVGLDVCVIGNMIDFDWQASKLKEADNDHYDHMLLFHTTQLIIINQVINH
jgi:hypothetical protein